MSNQTFRHRQKNLPFSQTESGAIFYCIIETAKANYLSVLEYVIVRLENSANLRNRCRPVILWEFAKSSMGLPDAHFCSSN
jgi:hypothetical protein